MADIEGRVDSEVYQYETPFELAVGVAKRTDLKDLPENLVRRVLAIDERKRRTAANKKRQSVNARKRAFLRGMDRARSSKAQFKPLLMPFADRS